VASALLVTQRYGTVACQEQPANTSLAGAVVTLADVSRSSSLGPTSIPLLEYEGAIVLKSLQGSFFSESSTARNAGRSEINEKFGGFIELSVYDPGYCMVTGHLTHRITLPIGLCVNNIESLFSVQGPYVRYSLGHKLDLNGMFSGTAIGYVDETCNQPFSAVIKDISFAGVCNDFSAAGNVTLLKSVHPFGRSVK
jgi:hypothetical protein